jgi:hypothetical protein
MPPCPIVVGQVYGKTAFVAQEGFVGVEEIAVPGEEVGL